MKFSTVVAVLALFGVASVNTLSLKNKVESSQTQKLFSNFVSRFARNYKNQDEFNTRLSNFAKNLEIINKSNQENQDYVLDLNKFADLSNAEYKSMLGFRADLIPEESLAEMQTEVESEQTVPTAWDWRSKTGVVSTMKNQASCGSCYSFAALEALQSVYHIKKGAAASSAAVINLSEQQVVDCSTGYKNQGCNGGLMEYVYNYLKVNPIQLEADYPYVSKKQTCKAVASKGQFKVTGYTKVTPNSPVAHKAALQNGPISIALRSGSSAFQLYKSGILSGTACGTSMDHAVTMIGYGSENGKDYWIIKNSWGTGWGEQGFARIARNDSGTDKGVCGLLQYSIQPTAISI